MNKEFLELFNSLSEDVRDLLLTQNPDGTYSINGNNFKVAFDKARTIDERNLIAEIFLRHSISTDDKWKGMSWDDLEPYKDVMIKICYELGFKELQNPFLVFLPNFYKMNANYDLSRNNMIDLNNLYATDDLTREDLMGKGRRGFNNIIFNQNLYENENVDKMVQYWNWLSNSENLSKMNWREVLNQNFSNRINSVARELLDITSTQGGKLPQDVVDKAVDYIFFTDSGKTVTQNTLEQLLSAGSLGENKRNRNSKTQSLNIDDDSLIDSIVDYSRSNGLTEVELKAVFADVLNKLGL